MKLNIALHILAAICTASRARARATSFLRDPRTVKEKVRRQTMGDHVSTTMLGTEACDADGNCAACGDRLADAGAVVEADMQNQNIDIYPDEVKARACVAVLRAGFGNDCGGCQGFSQVGSEVHIPGCIDLSPADCAKVARSIVAEKPEWFKDGGDTVFDVNDWTIIEIADPGEMAYYKLALPVSAYAIEPKGSKVVTGVAGDCMVHYPWDWCVHASDETNVRDNVMCIKLPPWDCSGVGGECLNTNECCAKIQVEYPKPDINGNELQCYEWVLPAKPSGSSGESGGVVSSSGNGGGSSGSSGVTGNRIVIHTRFDSTAGKQLIALPAVITDENHQLEQVEDIIVLKDEENILPKEEEENNVPQETQQGCVESFPEDKGTLKKAVIAYVNENCATDPNCDIGKAWGYPINSWCVEKVTSFQYMFLGLRTFNEDVNGWTISQVTTMDYTFASAHAFNQPLNDWDVSSVNVMSGMFSGVKAFNQPLNNWDVSSVTNMASMFYGDEAFDQPLDNWDVSSVTNMGSMFLESSNFNQPLDNWDVSSVTNMLQMFTRASSFDQPLGNWNTTSVTNMGNMFSMAIAFNQPLNNWDVSSVTAFYSMFYSIKTFNQNLCQWGECFKSEANYDDMFYDTACPNKGDPTSADGHWCQAC